MIFEIKEATGVAVVERDDGYFDVNADYCLLETEDGQRIEFGGHPWQESLTQERVDAINVGGHSVSDLLEWSSQ